MARGPYQGTWRPGVRPTVVTAPDALVYINGEPDLLGCPQCKRKFDLNKYITSIQVDLNVDSPPGSASISMSVPRHTIDDLYFEGNLILTPMMEVEIYAKGYFLLEGIPQYYPIFWGLINEVTDSYSGGEHSISISCSDILKWWEICKMNINPAFTQALGTLGRNIFGNVFFGTNPYDVIWTLAQQSFGDIIVGSGSLTSTFKEATQQQTFNAALSDIMTYWEQRFSRIRSNLLLYGTNGTAVRGDVLYDMYAGGPKNKNTKTWASQAVRKANGGQDASQMVFDPTDPQVQAFRTQFMNAGQVNFWQAEYQTKLELANLAKEAIGFEFFMDVDGSIVFKPPFYNLDVLPNKPVSWIQDIDIIDWDFSESEAEVVTQVQLQGNFGGNIDYGFSEDVTPFTSVTDYHLLRKYGWRQQTYNSEFLADPQLMFYMGLDLLDRYNSRRHRGTVNIPLRPELRLGFPIYVAPKDQFWYIQGISHNIQFGGRAQTTLSLTAKRQKFIAPKGIGTLKITAIHTSPNSKQDKPITQLDAIQAAPLTGRDLTSKVSFELSVGEAAQLPPVIPDQSKLQSGDNPFEPLILRHPKTGRIVGYPNVCMAYTRPFQPTPAQLGKNEGRDPNVQKKVSRLIKAENAAAPKQLQDIATAAHTYQKEDAIRDDQLTHRYMYGLNSAGVYTYVYDPSQDIQEIILPSKSRITTLVNGQPDTNILGKKGSAMIRPVSDDRGFEVIGHFKYGRGVYLRDGQLVLSQDLNELATVDTQVALSGGLFEMISAQSQGITVVTSTFPNPVEAIVSLQPEEQQTAGRINPDTKKPVFTDQEKVLLAASAPIGSTAQQGLEPSVEASQLSRALTLAEMTIKEPVIPNDQCICLSGRSDLAFINVGYQVKTLFNSTTTEDTSTLPTTSTIQGGPTSTTIESLNSEKAALEADPLNDIDPATQAANQARINQINEQLASEEALTTADGNRPLASYSVFPTGETITRVEGFLINLYQALDTDHQQFEKGLRGELLPQPALNPDDVRFGQGFSPTTQAPFSPPFNAPNRAAGGDPAALAIAGSSALGDLKKTWGDFGNKLAANTQRAALEQSIRNDQADLKITQTERDRLQAFIDAGPNAGKILPGNIPQQIADLDKKISRLQQDIGRKQQQANTLPT